MSELREWGRIAGERTVVVRGLKYAVVVGAVLVIINHGDRILQSPIDGRTLVKIGLTVLVPYCVSVLSSVAATRTLRRPAEGITRVPEQGAGGG